MFFSLLHIIQIMSVDSFLDIYLENPPWLYVILDGLKQCTRHFSDRSFLAGFNHYGSFDMRSRCGKCMKVPDFSEVSQQQFALRTNSIQFQHSFGGSKL